ncbi:hypothetical protein K4K57_008393 [Colletotrichum sp. SAR 10_99]|nr:hypothetical protein K4K55_007900 [Colletotrichum sp. SAR 10_96]KAI8268139.1 hypothetical protein K4K56_004296 [Colletotrichum sp. SAR 10_98]KAJ5009699.1 hypothetical protein K4K57_008393 [Colletotrichum sp. SAR 10_99]
MNSPAPTRRRGQPQGTSSLPSEKMDTSVNARAPYDKFANGLTLNGQQSSDAEKSLQGASRIIVGLFSQWIAVGVMLGLIFGGCCSNVYALEAIINYDISVPVHIILRSGGSITTMIAGSLYGKKYSRIQIVAVILLTLGVITAAWSDSQSKYKQVSWAE